MTSPPDELDVWLATADHGYARVDLPPVMAGGNFVSGDPVGRRLRVRLAQHLGLGASSTSHLVLNLVERGLMDRVEDPRDRRQRTLSITPVGAKLLDAHREERAANAARRLGPVPEALLRDLTETVGRCLLHIGV